MSTDNELKPRHPGLWVPTLYTAEGLPFVVVNVVSVLMYKSMGKTDGEIAFFTTLVALPWMLKPFWGPVLEMFKTKKYFVIATQFAGGVLFGLLALTLATCPVFFNGLLFSLPSSHLILPRTTSPPTACMSMFFRINSNRNTSDGRGHSITSVKFFHRGSSL